MRLIDADALIHELNNSHFPGAPYIDAGISIAIGKVLDAPTIEPQRKKGRWINANDGKWNTVEVLKCSVCGEMDNRIYRTDNFCPNCGAKMEGR